MEYLDTGARDPSKTLHAWLASKLPEATYFGCQSGYFTADALYAFEADVRAILDGGGEVRLVLGANEDELKAADLNDALDLLEPFSPRASVTIVRYPSADLRKGSPMLPEPGIEAVLFQVRPASVETSSRAGLVRPSWDAEAIRAHSSPSLTGGPSVDPPGPRGGATPRTGPGNSTTCHDEPRSRLT